MEAHRTPPASAERRRSRGAARRESLVLAWFARDRARDGVRGAFRRVHARVRFARSVAELRAALRRDLVDLAMIDLGAVTAGGPGAREAIALARDFPTVGFVALAGYRLLEAPAIARCAAGDFADVLADGIDDDLLPHVLETHGFSARFARALCNPPPVLALRTPLQRAVWSRLVAGAGRAVRTTDLARAHGVTREHLSRSFSRGGVASLKQVIDLARILAAAELAKNPGYDMPDVARVLRFASASHLSATVRRVAGTRAASLPALRGVDVIERFVRGLGGAAHQRTDARGTVQ